MKAMLLTGLLIFMVMLMTGMWIGYRQVKTLTLEEENENLKATLRRIIAMTLDTYIIEIAKHALGEGDDPDAADRRGDQRPHRGP